LPFLGAHVVEDDSEAVAVDKGTNPVVEDIRHEHDSIKCRPDARVNRVQQVDGLGAPLTRGTASEHSGVEGEAALEVPPTGYTATANSKSHPGLFIC